MSRRTIEGNLELRAKGWSAAARSSKTPPWLRPSLRKLAKDAERKLEKRRLKAKARNSRPS
jgi:hypothetical protein